jgi:hypothetical protein
MAADAANTRGYGHCGLSEACIFRELIFVPRTLLFFRFAEAGK